MLTRYALSGGNDFIELDQTTTSALGGALLVVFVNGYQLVQITRTGFGSSVPSSLTCRTQGGGIDPY